MSNYQYKGKPAAPTAGIVSVEQERRRNAELMMTLRQLEMQRAQLEFEAENVASVLRALRGTVDNTRDATTKIASYKAAVRQLPLPKYGGREGLLAATKEIESHDVKARPRKPRPGPAHGSWRRYYEWKCRCETCNEWRETQRVMDRERYYARKQKVAA